MDPNITLVFETIGQIKRSLQCSICLDLLNDPHSTKCNHQFCSQCIRKVVDDRRDKKKEALCPLCKNPVTKRSLTSNPRLKEIIDVVKRLNGTFKQDTGIPDSPYPVVNSRNVKESNESYLQFVAAHPTPQKPLKGDRNDLDSVSVNGGQHVRSSSSHNSSKQNTDTPSRRPSRTIAEQVVPTISLPNEEIACEQDPTLLETDVTPRRNEDTNNENSNGKPSDDNKLDDANVLNGRSTNSEELSGTSTVDVAKSSKSPEDSQLTCRSVSILESLSVSETNDEPITRNSPVGINHRGLLVSQHKANSSTANKQVNDVSEEYPYIGDISASTSDPVPHDNFNSTGLNMQPKNRLKRTSPPFSKRKTTTSDPLNTNETAQQPSLNKQGSEEEMKSSCEFVPGSIESSSSDVYASGGICIPRLEKFLVPENVESLRKTSTTENKLIDCKNARDEIVNDQKESKLLQDCTANRNLEKCAPAVQLLPGRSSPGITHNVCENREIISPGLSSGKVTRSERAKRKHGGDGKGLGRKCRRLNEANEVSSSLTSRNVMNGDVNDVLSRTTERNQSETLDTSVRSSDIGRTCNMLLDEQNDKSEEREERLRQSFKKNTKTNKNKNSSSENSVNSTDFEKGRSVQSAENDIENGSNEERFSRNIKCYKNQSKFFETTLQSANVDDEMNGNLNVKSRQAFGRAPTTDNDTEDEIVPPTPPVHVDLQAFSPSASKASNEDNAGNAGKMSLKQHDDGQDITVLTKEVAETNDIDELFDLECDDPGTDHDAGYMVQRNETSSPVEKLSSSQEDFLEPCDQDNIGLLRSLGSASNKESENETDDDVSDSRTADTTSVSSLNEADCMDPDLEISSQRIQYLHQVLADTGGEIEKLTADLKTLRDSESNSVQLNEEPDEESENDEDDDDKRSCRSLSPPPTPEPSTFTLTKLPASIKDMQKMLQDDSDSDDISSQRHQRSTPNKFRPPATKPASVTPHVAYVRRRNDSTTADIPTTNVEKENDLRHSVAHFANNEDLAAKDSERNTKKNNGEPVLTERQTNPKPTIFSTKDEGSLRNVHKPISFVVTRLPKKFVSLAGYLAKRNGGNLTGDLTKETTHVIMPTDSQMFTSRKNYTIKYLLGIALGKWIISQLWLAACMKADCLIDERPFEVKGDPDAAQTHVPNLARTTRDSKGPGLFGDISLICFGDFNGAISQVHITQLVQFCGGQIIYSKQEAINKKISDLVVITDSVISKRTVLLVKDICETYNTFPVSAEWVTDSVANYQLQDIEEYRLDR